MARALSSALVLALLAATAVAFAVTEGTKLEKSPIYGTTVPTAVFSPDGLTKPVAQISFKLSKRETVEAWIEDSKGHRIRTLLRPRAFRARAQVNLVWDGISDSGLTEPDGVYQPVVKLERSHRTIVLPNTIRLDTVPPKIVVKHPLSPILSPDGDHHGDTFAVHYTVSEPAHGVLYVNGARTVYTLAQKRAGELVWNGKVKVAGKSRPASPGRYVLSVAAVDRAGNVSKPYPFAIAQVRYVVLARTRVTVRPHGRFAIRVSTDAPSVRWRLHGRSGVERRGTLHFRAPAKAGVYHLYVYVGDHAARASVVVG